MAKIIDRTGKGSAITAAEHDSNLSTLALKNQAITATSHTIDVDDQGEVLEYSNASPIAVTLPTIASISGTNIHTDDFSVTLKNIGAGLVTVTRGGTDTFEGGGTSITIQRGETVTIMTDSSLAIWNILSDKNQIHYYGGASAAGTDTYAATLPRPPAAYETGRKYYFKADVANTGACTINFNTIGAASIKLQDGNDPYNNAIIANQLVELMYDGTNMVLLNPAIVEDSGSWTITVRGSTTAGSATYTTRTAAYVRFGSIMYVSASVLLSSKGGLAGDVQITGFPIAASNDSELHIFSISTSAIANRPSVHLSTSTGTFRYFSSTVMTALQDTDITDTFSFELTGFYLI